MTTREIIDRLAKIKSLAGDDEAQHGEEIDLRRDFITYVAELSNHSLAEKARLVLSSKEIEFHRGCA